jgi:hypothetical protein
MPCKTYYDRGYGCEAVADTELDPDFYLQNALAHTFFFDFVNVINTENSSLFNSLVQFLMLRTYFKNFPVKRQKFMQARIEVWASGRFESSGSATLLYSHKTLNQNTKFSNKPSSKSMKSSKKQYVASRGLYT